MKKLQWAAGLLLSFSVIAILLISSFEIAMYADFSVYQKEYEKYDVLDELDMDMEDVMYVTEEMMAYLRGDRDTLSVVTTVEGKEQDFFNEQDRFHMGEVRDLFIGGLNIRTGAVIVSLICLVFLIASKARGAVIVSLICLVFLIASKARLKKILARSYQIALGITGAAVLFIGAAAIIDFNAVFVQFHHIFFDNDLWLFDPAEDYMIRMLPEGLFADMVLRIGVLFIAGLLILLIISIAAGRFQKKMKSD